MTVAFGGVGERRAARPGVHSTAGSDRLFFSGMAIAVLLTVFAGFAPTYYLKGYFAAPALSLLVHVHGALFTSWIVLFVLQTMLVASRHTRIHRRIGPAGGVLAAAMIPIGTMAAINAVQRGATPPGVPPLAFLAIPLCDMLVFGVLIGTGLYYRKRSDTHKRLMLLGTISVLTAAIARLPFVLSLGPIAYFGLTDVFVLACFAYDLATRRLVHQAFLWGGLVLVASQPLRLMLSGTDTWMGFAAWLTRG